MSSSIYLVLMTSHLFRLSSIISEFFGWYEQVSLRFRTYLHYWSECKLKMLLVLTIKKLFNIILIPAYMTTKFVCVSQ